MKKRKNILLIIVLVLVIREVFPLDLSWNRRSSSYQTNINSSSSSTEMELTDFPSEFHSDVIDLHESDDILVTFTGLSVRDENYDKPRTINVSVSDQIWISSDRFLPLFKPIDFDCDASYSWYADLLWNDKRILIQGHGDISIRGENTIYGLSSAKGARKSTQAVIEAALKEAIIGKVREVVHAAAS